MKNPIHAKPNFGLAILLAGLASQAFGAAYYVAPTGDDGATGAKDRPFATMARGQTAAQAGDTVYFRGGAYLYKSSSADIGVTLNKSGAAGRPIHYLAYPGEKPVFDFSGMTAVKRIKGMLVTGRYLHLKGLELKGVPQSAALKTHESWGLYVDDGGNADGGSDNVFEELDLHHNMGPGFFLKEGGNNQILNCDSHDNYDLYSYARDDAGNIIYKPGENGDGFGVHVAKTSSTGNVFRGCRAWWNADDGWDMINCLAAVMAESCWSWGNGYKTGINPPQAAGNGNGFKVGGFGATPDPGSVPSPIPRHIIRFCLAFDNRAHGFYQNHHPASNYFYNNTAFNNKSSNFNLHSYDIRKEADASMGIFRNNLAFMGPILAKADYSKDYDAASNSWNLAVTVVASDFESVDTAGVAGKRIEGNLPELPFMKLKPGIDLIDRGMDVKLSFAGKAPDLGAFETGRSTGIGGGEPGSSRARRTRVVPAAGARDAAGRFHPGSKPVTLWSRRP